MNRAAYPQKLATRAKRKKVALSFALYITSPFIGRIAIHAYCHTLMRGRRWQKKEHRWCWWREGRSINADVTNSMLTLRGGFGSQDSRAAALRDRAEWTAIESVKWRRNHGTKYYEAGKIAT